MVRDQNFNPFLFPSTSPEYSNLSSSSSALPSSPCQSSASLDSPLESYSPAPPPCDSSTAGSSASVFALGPCVTCKLLGRLCTDKCSSSAFQLDESEVFTIIDRLFAGQAPTIINFIKTVELIKEVDHPNGTHQRDSPENGLRAMDHTSGRSVRNALRTAEKLMHLADRLKNSEIMIESARVYFQAALKFLHAASMLETCNNGNTNSGEMIRSMQVYSSGAKLCEHCALEYEKSKDMAAAALAYKCMEVAYMRVVYSSHNNANKHQNELQPACQMAPSGESRSDDVDNSNHQATMKKGISAESVTSPLVTNGHVNTSHNHPNSDLTFALEASRKSQLAFNAAKASSGEPWRREGIYSTKRALDFGFQDVEEFLRLVRLAMEAISD